MVYTTKYSKNQPKRVKKYAEGGPVDDEDAVEVQMAENRLKDDGRNFRKDLDIAYQSPKRVSPLEYTEDQQVDKQMARNRMDNTGRQSRNDIATSVRKSAKRK